MGTRKSDVVTDETIMAHFRRFGANGLTTSQLVTSLGMSQHSVLDRLRKCKELACTKSGNRANLWRLKPE